MGMFVHADHDENDFYAQQSAMETLGITSVDINPVEEKASTPLTVFDIISGSVRDLAVFIDEVTIECPYKPGYMRQKPCDTFEECVDCWEAYLNSPCQMDGKK